MKKFIILIGLILIATSAYATPFKKLNTITNNYYSTTNIFNEQINNSYGAKLDAPYLVELHKDWYFGAEGGKEIISSNASSGWNANLKVTYTGTLFSFKKDK